MLSDLSDLSDAQLERYARHIVLKEIGGEGQRRLLDAHVAVVGAGGIGSPVLLYLAAAGIGRLTVWDDDRVALSNLQRQLLFKPADVGRAKIEVAADTIRALNPATVFVSQGRRVTADSFGSFAADAVVIVDGSDSFATRLAVADGALAARIPLVSAAVGQFEGQLAVYRGWEPGKPCYRCLVGAARDRAEESCAEQGVLGALTGVLGSLAAIEAIRQIVPFGEDTAGLLLLVDALAFRFRTLTLAKDPGCACAT